VKCRALAVLGFQLYQAKKEASGGVSEAAGGRAEA
jgi:hypothetical protein